MRTAILQVQKLKLLLPLLVCLATCYSAHATTRFVKAGHTGTSPYTSWATADSNLQNVINAAGAGDTIWVAAGKYQPATSFSLKEGVKIYGGFTGTETTFSQRNSTVNHDTLRGNELSVILCGGNITRATVLDGFVITLGVSSAGAGMFCTHASPIINNCTFLNNVATASGGGIMLQDSSAPLIRNCSFIGNGSQMYGGAICADSSMPYIINCTFTGNNASKGGALYLATSSPVVNSCSFSHNSGSTYGGGVYNDTSSPAFINCTFIANTTYSGSAMYNLYSAPSIRNCTFYGNNSATSGAIYNIASSPLITNSIIWGNTGTINNDGLSTPVITYSDVLGLGGVGNISSVPIFANTASEDFRLRLGSPGINAGNNDSISAFSGTDITGARRIRFGTVDMGAYESPYTVCGPFNAPAYYVDSSVAVSGNGSSWGDAFKTLSDALAIAQQCGYANTIFIAKGTYYPTGVQNDTARDSSFVISSGGIKIYGGYPSGGGTRNITANPTILSGDIGLPGNNADNSYHVMVVAGLSSAADSVVVDGLTLRDGNANATFSPMYGGTNAYGGNGGGVYIIQDSLGQRLAFRDVTVTHNYAGNVAGGFEINSAAPFIYHCNVSANSTASNGSSNWGGGIFTELGASPLIVNSFINGNTANNGGGLYNYSGTPVVSGCVFTGNTANSMGGGIFDIGTSCMLINCTISGNTAYTGSGVYSSGGVQMFNTIDYGNTDLFTDLFGFPAPHGIASYSDVQGTGSTSGGNVNTDPLFINSANPIGADNVWGTADDGLQLSACSPVINAGNNNYLLPGIASDMTGTARIQLGIVDMGAYEATSVELADTSAAISLVQSGTQFYTTGCHSLIATITSNGTNPASGMITAKAIIDTTAQTYNTQPYVRRHYDITPADTTVAGSGTATITLYFTQADFDDYNAHRGAYPALPTGPSDAAGIANFSITQEHGFSSNDVPGSYTGWTGTGPANVVIWPALTWNVTFNRWGASFPVTGFSGFFAAAFTGWPLNIALDHISATNTGSVNRLDWNTLSEQPGDIFDIEHSKNGKDFQRLGELNASGNASGNTYSYIDEQPYDGINYYRLKLRNKDGSGTYSKIVSATVSNSFSVTVYPNPAKDVITVSVKGENRNDAILQLCDITGKVLVQTTLEGNDSKVISMNSLPAGTYLLRYTDQQNVKNIKVEKK